MASSVKLWFLLIINFCIILMFVSLINCELSEKLVDKQIDSEPKELGLHGDQTPSAKHGWKVLWDDINKSLMTTKLYQSTEGKRRKAIKNLISKPNDSHKSGYSPKRSSKCLFGTPDPKNNCGPEFVASLVTNEYQEFAQRLWKKYLLKNVLV